MAVSKLVRKIRYAKIVPKPGTIQHGSVVCCAGCERCMIVDGDDSYKTPADTHKTSNMLESQGWRRTLGRWLCGECAG